MRLSLEKREKCQMTRKTVTMKIDNYYGETEAGNFKN